MEEELDQVRFGVTERVTFTLSEEWCNLFTIFLSLHYFLKVCDVMSCDLQHCAVMEETSIALGDPA